MSRKDCISALPDSLLQHILSFLDDTKQVQQTSVLSKRWKYIWISVPTLAFLYPTRCTEEETKKFVEWVHNTLLKCQNTSIEKFSVTFPYYDSFGPDVDCWARFVSEKRVKDLSLINYNNADDYIYSLPNSIYFNSFLQKLNIESCELMPKLGLRWGSLKSLSMSYINVNEDTIAKILLGSPMLEYLNIYCCFGFAHLIINSKSLIELIIDSYGEDEDELSLVEISAPNLQSLHLLGFHYKIRFRLISVSSNVKVNLDFWATIGDKNEFLESLHHVQELELGSRCIQELAPLLVECKTLSSSPFTALTCLKVNAFINKRAAAGFISLLKCSPNLERLVLEMQNFGPEFSCPESVEEYWGSRRMFEKFSLPRLKTVKCYGSEKLGKANEFTLALFQVILENTSFLEFFVRDA